MANSPIDYKNMVYIKLIFVSKKIGDELFRHRLD